MATRAWRVPVDGIRVLEFAFRFAIDTRTSSMGRSERRRWMIPRPFIDRSIDRGLEALGPVHT